MAKGRLTIFTGYSSGVGKSHIMLQRAIQEYGDNVVIGFLNEQQRKINGIEIFGSGQVGENKKIYIIDELINSGNCSENKKIYSSNELINSGNDRKNKKVYSINELINLGKNNVVILDEMGMGGKCVEHSSFIYEDIEILLNQGIDVYTSTNLKRFSGINDEFRRISGIGVRKTVPLKYLDMAEHIVLVDREPDELIKDYRMGKLFNEKNQKSKITKKNFTPDILKEYEKLTFKILETYGEKVEIVYNKK